MRARAVLTGLSVMALLLVSGILFGAFNPTPAAHAASSPVTAVAGDDWTFPFGNNAATNNSPQTQITMSNVNSLQIAWIFPFPAVDNSLPGVVSGPTATPSLVTQGPGSPPIINNGIVYEVNNQYDIYAFNAGTGQVIWTFQAPVAYEAFNEHLHGITYYDGQVWMTVPGHGYIDVIGLNGLSGKLQTNITNIAQQVTGQRYEPTDGVSQPNVNKNFYDPAWPPIFYKDIMVVEPNVPDSITRGFNAAYNITTGKLLWLWYAVPPAPNCDPKWDSEDLVTLGNGTTVNYGAPPGNITPYPGDWGTNCDDNGGGGMVFSAAVDNQTGIMYGVNLGGYPAYYAGTRPGPDLYESAITAINMTNGKMMWFYDSDPHNTQGDADCEWGTVLTTVNGVKEVAAECHWYLYGLNAKTGALMWSYNPVTNQATGTNPTQYPGIGINMGNAMNMTEAYPYAFAPYHGKYLINNTYSENALAYDGKDTIFTYNDINPFGASFNNCANGPPTNTNDPGWRIFDQVVGAQTCTPSQSASVPAYGDIAAINESTGQIEWSHVYPAVLQRGGMTYSNGMLFVGTNDGNLRVYNAATGALVMERQMGVALNYSPTIGATIDGVIMAYLPVGGGILWGAVPGFLAAFAITAPSGVSTSSVTTLASTTTLTTITTSTGVSSTVFYGVTALAVVFIIVSAALLATRGRGKRTP